MLRGLSRFPGWRIVAMALASILALTSAAAAVLAQGIPSGSSVMINVDSPAAGSTVTNGQVTFVGGWAADAVGSGTGIDRVEIYIDSPLGTRIGRARYGTSRPDVARAHNMTGWTNSGFAFDWRPVNLLPGEHTLYVVAYTNSGVSATHSVTFNAVYEDQGPCPPSPQCPLLIRTNYGWEIDTGGPFTRIDRDPGIVR